ncbi:hypothetical protein JHK87_051175 [Glycine soja]|nr:hypothetical protein JHK87_051175 [Glycine soja]
MAPPGPCELVRGYLHFSPHAWNIILIKRGATWVQMLIDACRPLDIRQEKDPEYFCRYVRPESKVDEANIWLFGCLLLEMLTLQIPYSGLSDSHFLDSLQMGKRPQLTDELRVLSSMNGPTMIPSGEELEKSDAGVDMLKFLFDLFHKCVEQNPSKYVFRIIGLQRILKLLIAGYMLILA